MIQRLKDFYILDGKLLFACKDFIGYDPTISKPFVHEIPVKTGTKAISDEFQMNGCSFNVILTCSTDSAPLRGFKRIEIIKDGQTIINYEKGGKGHGTNYSKGNYYLVESGNAFLVATGGAMKYFNDDIIYNDLDSGSYFFLWFKDIVIPSVEESVNKYDAIPNKEIYSRNDIQHLRQTEWWAKTIINNREIEISKSSIPNFMCSSWNHNGQEEFRKDKRMNVLVEMNFLIDGKNHLE